MNLISGWKKMMSDNPFNPFDITAGYWYYKTKGGARKYILILSVTPKGVKAFRITSRFAKKSKYIQQQYYEIKNYRKAGMIKQSWIDIRSLRRFSLNKIELKKRGELSIEDQIGLINFIKNYPERIKKLKEEGSNSNERNG